MDLHGKQLGQANVCADIQLNNQRRAVSSEQQAASVHQRNVLGLAEHALYCNVLRGVVLHVFVRDLEVTPPTTTTTATTTTTKYHLIHESLPTLSSDDATHILHYNAVANLTSKQKKKKKKKNTTSVDDVVGGMHEADSSFDANVKMKKNSELTCASAMLAAQPHLHLHLHSGCAK
ncbi:unnamed protein product [Ceratitis capitata]|uniref:(Mediterranean fruit fly) hypothetical protein n=1 Tax=Ceratitis capitata TaxID=7213 RepID=A0A811VJC1_CERCA|nr:unnamed protein product [Ceratitis capitata]